MVIFPHLMGGNMAWLLKKKHGPIESSNRLRSSTCFWLTLSSRSESCERPAETGRWGGGDSYRIWPLIMMQTPWKMEMLAKIKCSWSTLKTSFLQYKGMNKLQLSKNLSSQNSASLHVFQLFFHFAQAIMGIFCLTGGQFVGGIAHGQAKGWKGRLRGVNL